MLPSLSSLLPFLLFAFVASITPGPTNIMILRNSTHYGFTAILPAVVGASASAASMILVMGYGLGEFMAQKPILQITMKCFGLLWLSYLAWKIWHSSPVLHELKEERLSVRNSLFTAVALQWINPKAWMMSLVAISVFTGSADSLNRIMFLGLAFFAIAVPCLTVWALLGKVVITTLRSPLHVRYFNRVMGCLLIASSLPSLWAG